MALDINFVHYDAESGTIRQVNQNASVFEYPGYSVATFVNVKYWEVSPDTTQWKVDLGSVYTPEGESWPTATLVKVS